MDKISIFRKILRLCFLGGHKIFDKQQAINTDETGVANANEWIEPEARMGHGVPFRDCHSWNHKWSLD
jgi:hypothetical protein